jgi:toxin ParE1/3/4
VKAKPVIPRSQADRDVDGAIAYYLEQRAVDAALGFIDALERAYGDIGRHPAAGSPRYAHELNLPDLRFWLVPGYPYVVFYVECDDHVDVWRVLHAQRDVPSRMVE